MGILSIYRTPKPPCYLFDRRFCALHRLVSAPRWRHRRAAFRAHFTTKDDAVLATGSRTAAKIKPTLLRLKITLLTTKRPSCNNNTVWQWQSTHKQIRFPKTHLPPVSLSFVSGEHHLPLISSRTKAGIVLAQSRQWQLLPERWTLIWGVNGVSFGGFWAHWPFPSPFRTCSSNCWPVSQRSRASYRCRERYQLQ